MKYINQARQIDHNPKLRARRSLGRAHVDHVPADLNDARRIATELGKPLHGVQR
jgi:hypothetical protein